MKYIYKFNFLVEARNTVLHILVGAVVAHTFLPYLPIHWILIILFILGAGREVWQNIRGKIQPWWISSIDAISFVVGGYVWWLIIMTYNINVDFL